MSTDLHSGLHRNPLFLHISKVASRYPLCDIPNKQVAPTVTTVVENAKMMIRKNAALMALIEAPASEYTMKLLLSLIYEKVNSFD